MSHYSIRFTKDDHVVQAFASDGSDQAFSVGILPGGFGRGQNLIDAHAINSSTECLAEDAVAVADHVRGCGVLWKGFDDRLSGPGGAWEFGDVEAAIVSQNEEDEEHTKGGRGDSEKVDGGEGAERSRASGWVAAPRCIIRP